MTNQTTNLDENNEISSDPLISQLVDNITVAPPEKEVVLDVKDSPKEGNPSKEELIPSGGDIVKDSDETGQPDTSEDVQAAISKAVSGATEKHMKILEEVVRKLPKEELMELEERNPQLFNKLKNSIPEVFVEEEISAQPGNKAERLEKLIEAMVHSQEQAAFNEWRDNNAIGVEDYNKKSQEFEETAKTLFELETITDWNQALKLAGEIHFPHLSGKPVDTEKLARIQGQRVSVSSMAPSSRGGEFTEEDYTIMRREGVTEAQYREALSGEILPPGIL